MKGFGKVFRFELKNYLQNRLFVGITFFLVIAIAVVLCFPRFTEPSAEEAKVSGELPVMLVALLLLRPSTRLVSNSGLA